MWCSYEIGLFRRPSDPYPPPIICIKDPSIESLPSLLEKHITYQATEVDIQRFLEDLLYKGKFTNNDRINEKLFKDDNYILLTKDFVKAFKPVGIERKFYARRALFDLKHLDRIETDGVLIKGDPYTMEEILLSHRSFTYWQNLYDKFKAEEQSAWLDQIKESIEIIKKEKRPTYLMKPFIAGGNKKFIPVLTRVEQIPTEDKKAIILLKIYVTFIPWSNIEKNCDLINFVSDESNMIVKPIFSIVKERTNSKLVFTLMPFKKEKNLQEVYDNYTKTIVESFGLNCVRADDIFKHHMIMEDIWEHICTTRFVISDLTDKNPNVFYELGMAHTVGKRVILITQNDEDVPFDLRHLRYIKYEFTPPGMEKFKDQLEKAIKSLLKAT